MVQEERIIYEHIDVPGIHKLDVFCQRDGLYPRYYSLCVPIQKVNFAVESGLYRSIKIDEPSGGKNGGEKT